MHSVLQINAFAQVLSANLANIRSPASLNGAFGDLVFETQWAWWPALAAVAVAAFFVGRTRANPRLIRAALFLAALIVLWIAVASLVDTPRERLRAIHESLARAVTARDIPTIAAALAPEFQAPDINIPQRSAAESEIRQRLAALGIKSLHITNFRSEILPSGDLATTHITVFTETELGTFPTIWELDWNDVPGQDWRIQRAKRLQ